MRKTKNCDKEPNKIKRLAEENKLLKERYKKLQKELDKIDINRYNNLNELIEAQYKEDKQIEVKRKKELLYEKWKCNDCEKGHLRLIILNRPDGLFYFRRCSNCGKRTTLKKYNSKVEGIEE